MHEKDSIIIPCVYSLQTNKTQATYLYKTFFLIFELKPALNPFLIMVDLDKTIINAFEDNFLYVASGCFFPFLPKHIPQNPMIWFTKHYIEDTDFALRKKM